MVIRRETRLGLIGYPLGHSLSPVMHRAALQTLGMAGDYRLYPVPPGSEGRAALQELFLQVRLGVLHGLNVTIPHKQAVIPWLDELTPVSQAIEAVNTIYLQERRLVGDNTDAPGFLAGLRKLVPSGKPDHGKRALVLGAGGSARAIVYALVQDGWTVYIAARRLEQARQLASSPAARSATALSLTASSIGGCPAPDLIVNATPVGMTPHLEESPWPAGLPFPARAALYDLVYNPPETALVRAARAAGLPASNGLGMLVEQAALAFQIWTGRLPPRQAMLQAAIEQTTEEGR